ncbi:inositol polyphosphate 1-phosphatase [Asbolus verrucosus]|uniref:inositol-1,4-bisphosphate 1-phosphatase n=1 Tax=Asbolus verrucosus TaxID=1661398 RepID=A0A482WAR1_ASBVE|nr:inositol polyphosphate 1-phosphatase [Asbolus verrucosus]
MDLLKSLIIVSEKAANIARLCRRNQHLFNLLIQKKSSKEANPRFVDDFKTLADVLIQELVKNQIGKQFPELQRSIKGEENNIFSNQLGETIQVEVKESEEETAALLQVVLNEDARAAQLLAREVHRDVSLDEVTTQKAPAEDFIINLQNSGVWIDPIDSTAEYINGIEEVSNTGISISGLKCVTVLIGVFDKTTGLPLIGVVNQPFVTQDGDQWKGECFWGGPAESSLPPAPAVTKTVCVSSSENPAPISKLQEKGYNITEASGAGYKILAVVKGLADAYVLSKDSTFKWDTCGPQAILRSLGGDVVVFSEAVRKQVVSVKYDEGSGSCNCGGIIAYRKSAVLEDVIECLT